ncbi:MAG: NTP transferase domain-containing protein, partial [Nitrospira sp.]|nr:NTP transferase domain-containing protein [Nitrospira sp.]
MAKSLSSVIVVIPARYGSSRFPGKPLVKLAGKPMIQHVYERAVTCRSVNEVLVATDDERIKQAVEQFGG